MELLRTWIFTISRLLFVAACGCCLVLVLLTTGLVVSRYFFLVSSVALQELQWHLFGAMFLLSVPHTFVCDKHVRVDILYARLSRTWQERIDIAGNLFFLMPMAYVLVVYGYSYVVQSRGYPSGVAVDYYSVLLLGREHFIYPLSAWFEKFLRAWLLVGEGSPDPGGLEARWLVKALIVCAFAVLLAQACATVVALLRGGKSEN
jgi:TRAP-type mannitol/chloroaromatic compound transport system permease small subunit